MKGGLQSRPSFRMTVTRRLLDLVLMLTRADREGQELRASDRSSLGRRWRRLARPIIVPDHFAAYRLAVDPGLDG